MQPIHGTLVLVASLEILVPWYVYPTHWIPESYVWDDLAASASTVPITAVLNPANGPGGAGPNADYLVGLADLRAAGVTMVGYVHTSYGARPIADVKADIDVWSAQWVAHGIHGIFLDEAASGASTLDYYQAVYDYARSRAGIEQVLVNPGVPADEGYLTRPATDAIVGFEDTAAAWELHVPPAYQGAWTPAHFAALVHTAPDTAALHRAIDLAASRGFGYVFVTDDTLSNPWDTLPSYWADEVSRVADRNASVASPPAWAPASWARAKAAFR